MGETVLDLAIDTAAEFGLTIIPEHADYVLWEHTGFPGFFCGDPEVALRRQLAAHFIGVVVGGQP